MTSALLPNPIGEQAATERPAQNKNQGNYKVRNVCKVKETKSELVVVPNIF